MNIINRKLNTFSLYLGKDAKSETNKLIVAPIKIHSPIFPVQLLQIQLLQVGWRLYFLNIHIFYTYSYNSIMII